MRVYWIRSKSPGAPLTAGAFPWGWDHGRRSRSSVWVSTQLGFVLGIRIGLRKPTGTRFQKAVGWCFMRKTRSIPIFSSYELKPLAF